MKPSRQRLVAAGAGVALLALGLAAGYWLADRNDMRSHSAPAPAPKQDGREVLYWYDPMVPDQRFDKPGKSPFMDMDLVPRYADEGDAAGVRIEPGVRQNLGVRTAVVEVGALDARIRVPGTLTWNLREEEIVSTPVQAIVSRLHIRAPFEPVRAGAPLAAVLSPEWGTAISEHRALTGANSEYARGLRSASRERLRILGLSDTTAAGNGTVVLRAPRSGVVSEILIREGQTAMPGTPLFRINGTATLWLNAAVPQAATAGMDAGTPVTATVDAVPGRTFEGHVETLVPLVDESTRTRQARIVLRNEEGLLAPGMFAQVTLQPDKGTRVPLVPTEALITTGDETRVIVTDAGGRYRPVRVQTGRSAGGRTEVIEGLSGGERVVTSGQFLIDSEASLSGALNRLGPQENASMAAGAPAEAPADPHAGHTVPAEETPR